MVRRAQMGIALLLGLLLVQAMPTQAQDITGRIVGRVLDASTARPVVGAQVTVEGTAVASRTDLNGRFVLGGIPASIVSLVVQNLGYATKRVTGVQVLAGQVTTLDVTMEEEALEISGITVSAAREQGSNAFLLDRRRTSEALVEAVGAAEIGRRPDSDAADVAQRMTGVTVNDGKYVFVRGLGERYSQTSLNGSSLPSPEPEREVVPLDLFPAGFLESLQTQKSYTPDQPVDFSGGAVQIRTKDFPDRLTIRAGVSTSLNTASQFKDGYLHYTGGGRDWLGLDDGTRSLPGEVERIMGGVRSGQRLPADPAQRIVIGQAFQELEMGFAPTSAETPLNRSFDLSVGGRRDLFQQGELGFFLAGTYSDTYAQRVGEVERKWRAEAFKPEFADLATPNVDYTFDRGNRAVSWGTIGNLTFKPNPSQKISLRSTVNVNTDDEARVYAGANSEDIGGDIRSQRSRFVERVMLWGQLAGEHATVLDSRLDWRLNLARATRDEPLMRETIYLEDPGSGDYHLLDFTESGRYFFSELVDDDISAEVDWAVPFDLLCRQATVKVGGAWRDRARDFGARRLNWRFLGSTIADLDATLRSAEVVASNPSTPNQLAINDVVEPGDVYGAQDRRAAGYAMLDLPVTDRLQAVVGARVERYELGLDSRGESLADKTQTDVAPSLNLIYSLRDDLKLRSAVSRTLDRPEFRELAPFQFTEATSLRQLKGNPDLESAQITSVDLRADWFPGPGELVSVGGFLKDMKDPIEQVFIAAASSAYSFQNAEKASVYGIEVDVQVAMGRASDRLRDLFLQANYSWIDSEVTVRPGGIYQPTNLTRPLEGQAAYVLNAGLNWTPPSGLEAGLFVNRFGERLSAAGGSGLPDIYEQPRTALDASLAFPLPRGVRAKVKATNLLDADYVFQQSDQGITRLQRTYTVGRTFSVGLSWEF